MLISEGCLICEEYISKMWWRRVFAKFTSLNSRIALQLQENYTVCHGYNQMSKPSHWRFFFLPVLYNCKQQPASFVIFSEHLNVVSRPVYFNFVEQMKIDFVFFYHENELPQGGFFDGQPNDTLLVKACL